MRAAIVGISGVELAASERRLFRELPAAGVILFARNIEAPAQVRALTRELREVLPPESVLMVDQEGGRVARLRPPGFRAHPAAGRIGALPDPAAERAAFLTGALIGAEAAACGFEVVTAPVLDRALPGADGVIGDRAFAGDPERVAVLGDAFAHGLLAAGIQPVGKHVPGHGRARADSHITLPELETIDDDDLLPFARLAGTLAWMMTAHIRYRGWGMAPATLSDTIHRAVIRGRLGFAGVVVSDDLAMGALEGTPGERAASAIRAGCDVVLHCSGDEGDSAAVLRAAGAVSPAARTRLAAARAAAQNARRALDEAALAAERDALLA